MNGIVKITALKGDQVLVKVNRGVPSDLLATITMVKDESVAAKDESVAAKDETLQVSALLGEVPLIQPDDANKYLKVKSDETGYELDVIDLSSKENALGNPASDGMKLVSTVAGVRSWAEDSGGASIGTGNYIAEPFAVTPGTGLEVSVAANRCVIDETVCESTTATTVALTAKAAQLIYKKKDGAYDKLLPKMTAADLVDANTVGLWFPDGSATIPNAAVGVYGNTLAVANALTKTGNITAVDGWAGGNAARGDGSTGYYTAANYTNIPTGISVFESSCLYTCVSTTTGDTYIMSMHNYAMYLRLSSGQILVYMNSGSGYGVSTGYFMEAGKSYLITWQYNGAEQLVFVNGQLISRATMGGSSGSASPIFYKNGSVGGYDVGIIHFVEIRNALRTPAQIATIAQEMLIPCVGTENAESSNANLQGSAISGGDYAGTPASYAYDGNASNEWSSLQNASHAGVSYIGRGGLTSKITKVKWVNSSIAGRNMNNFKYQYSFDGTTWIDLVAVYHIGTASAVFYDDIPEYPVAPYFRAMALDSLGGGSSWGVADIILYTGNEAKTDIRTVLPSDSMSVAYVETSETAPTLIIDGSNPSGATPDWAYGIRVGPMGALNRRKFLGWKYFSGGAYLYWDNPFDGRRANSHYVWASDTNGKNELRCMEDPNYGIVVLGTSAIPFGVNTSSNGVCRLNGTWQTSGYIGAYAEVID